jgi:hypothetical protein
MVTARDLVGLKRALDAGSGASLATCDLNGIPSVEHISQLYLWDTQHLAIPQSVAAPLLRPGMRAQVLTANAATTHRYRMDLSYVGSADAACEASALADRAFDAAGPWLFEILAVQRLPQLSAAGLPELSRDRLAHLGTLLERLHGAIDRNVLAERLLTGIAEFFDLSNSALLVFEGGVHPTLRVMAVHGNSRMRTGESHAFGDLLSASSSDGLMTPWSARDPEPDDAVSAAGVHDQILPISSLERMIGVLVLSSGGPKRLEIESETQLALSILTRLVVPRWLAIAAAVNIQGIRVTSGPTAGLAVRYYSEDASVFLDDKYLIKGAAGRILWVVLNQHVHAARFEFSNKELRLDPRLELHFRDNLEARLLLLRKRLAAGESGLRLPAISRGRFRVEVDRPISLEQVRPRRV